MINAIIEWSARNRFLVLLLTAMGVAGGIYAIRHVPLDAIPDLSDPQVIIYTEWPGRSPDLVEDQITYPVISAMLAAPNVSVVRGISDYGFSYVYVIFDEGTDIYWGRTRVLEYMDKIRGKLPEGVAPVLGPDATGVGWAFEYALVDRSGRHNLAEVRSFNDWYVRYWLESVPGVAEVATVGGFVKQYQVNVDPNRLLAFGIPLNHIIDVIKNSNRDVGGRVVEFTGKEYLVRGRGYIKSVDEIESLPLGTDGKGTPILVRNVAVVTLGADMRRGVTELNGEGEVTGGIVVVRHHENALDVIERAKAKLEAVKPGFPEGIEVVTTYDRSDLIHRSIETLIHTLTEELIIVSLVILLFLRHLPSAAIPIVTIPIAVIISFIPMYASGLTSNIMSLSGIAIAIGALVDAAIVVVEQTHKKLEKWEEAGRPGDYRRVIIDAVKEVGGPSFFSLLVIAVAFVPIFALQAQEGRLFKPLAFTKNTAMAVAAVLAITLDPALRLLFTRLEPFRFRPRWLSSAVTRVVVGTIEPEEKTWISRALMAVYHPAPLSMVETTVVLKPEKEWRSREVERWYSGWVPQAFKPLLRWLWPEERRITWEELIDEMDRAVQIPSFANAWLFPVRTRIDMITTGVRTPVGVKVMGPDLDTIERIGLDLEKVLQQVPGTRSASFERVTGGYYLDFEVNREEAARYGLSPGDVNDIVESAIGGNNITTTVEGRERYPVNVRYAREFRDELPKLRRVLVPTPSGAQIPLGQLATIELRTGPPMIKNEEGFKAGFFYVDVTGRDLGSYVEGAKKAVAAQVRGPPGYQLAWSGQYEYLVRVRQRLIAVIPIALVIIFLLLYLNTGSTMKTLIILLAVPFSAVGAILFIWHLGYNMSIAVWVGLIALLGVDAETGVFMLLYLDLAYEQARKEGRMRNLADLKEAIVEGAVKRLRPKVMTVAVMFMGLVPIMWSTGTGSDVMRRIAAPMIGGIFTSFLMELLVYPVIYEIWKTREVRRQAQIGLSAS